MGVSIVEFDVWDINSYWNARAAAGKQWDIFCYTDALLGKQYPPLLHNNTRVKFFTTCINSILHNTCIEIPVISNKELQILNLAWLIHFHREFSSSALSSHRWIECPLTKLIGLSFTNYGKLKGVFFRSSSSWEGKILEPNIDWDNEL